MTVHKVPEQTKTLSVYDALARLVEQLETNDLDGAPQWASAALNAAWTTRHEEHAELKAELAKALAENARLLRVVKLLSEAYSEMAAGRKIEVPAGQFSLRVGDDQ